MLNQKRTKSLWASTLHHHCRQSEARDMNLSVADVLITEWDCRQKIEDLSWHLAASFGAGEQMEQGCHHSLGPCALRSTTSANNSGDQKRAPSLYLMIGQTTGQKCPPEAPLAKLDLTKAHGRSHKHNIRRRVINKSTNNNATVKEPKQDGSKTRVRHRQAASPLWTLIAHTSPMRDTSSSVSLANSLVSYVTFTLTLATLAFIFTTTSIQIGVESAELVSSSASPSSASTLTATTSTSTNPNANAVASEQPFVFKYNQTERESDYWLESGRKALEGALQYVPNTQRAQNAILFIGDGMSLTTITAARVLQGQLNNRSGEEDSLSFEQLSNVALIKTYNIDQQVPDSAATATAILTGVKANFYTLGVNGNVKLNDTNCQRIQQNKVNSIVKQAQEAGKSTGIITNTRITHATPAAGYAHTSNRRWECDPYMPKNLEAPCKDIARQLIEDEPGSKLNVIMGGGRRCFFGPNYIDPGPSGQPGMRQDNRNLIDQWIARRRENNEQNYAFVNSTRDLRLINVDSTDYLLGLFSYSHMSYEELRDVKGHGEPSLSEMTEMAIKILSRNPKGYLLIVEGGRIDHAHHENVAGVALRETISLSWAVRAARNMVDQRDTLLAVTSDHAQGNPILGLSRYKENSTQLPYTTLIYGNGPGNQRPRLDPTMGTNPTDSPYYVQYAAIHQEEAFHDGSDVAIFASGPYAHLFQGVQEQSYIAHVFAYAMCIGDYVNLAHCRQSATNNNNAGLGVASNDLSNPDQSFDASTRTNTISESAGSGGFSAPRGRAAGGGGASPSSRLNDPFLSFRSASGSHHSATQPSWTLAMMGPLAVAALLLLQRQQQRLSGPGRLRLSIYIVKTRPQHASGLAGVARDKCTTM